MHKFAAFLTFVIVLCAFGLVVMCHLTAFFRPRCNFSFELLFRRIRSVFCMHSCIKNESSNSKNDDTNQISQNSTEKSNNKRFSSNRAVIQLPQVFSHNSYNPVAKSGNTAMLEYEEERNDCKVFNSPQAEWGYNSPQEEVTIDEGDWI
jgi:hypothetical protein